jgi:hypothetical protein
MFSVLARRTSGAASSVQGDDEKEDDAMSLGADLACLTSNQ